MASVYALSALVGFGWVALGLLLGQFGVDHGGDAEVSVSGSFGDGGHGDAVTTDGGSLHLPLFSPTAIAGYLMGFGATGYGLMRGLGVTNPLVHVPVSVAGAGVLGLAVAYATVRLLQAGETSSEASLRALAGVVGEVTVSIPEGGVGEVAYEAGTRRTSAARSTGLPLPRGARVRIVRADLEALLVEPAPQPALQRGEPVIDPQD